jgi:hypothetical protein
MFRVTMFAHLSRKLVVSILVLVLLAAAVAGCAASDSAEAEATEGTEDSEDSEGGMGMNADVPAIPAGLAYADGEEVYFVHTEASDAEIAELLGGMMDSPVFHVPSLADAPESMLADVYVFTNGPEGMGPLGFQPDVFGDLPGSDTYTPLRSIVLVTWADGGEARILKSVAEVQEAESAGLITLERPGVVVNMPFVMWPGGSR